MLVTNGVERPRFAPCTVEIMAGCNGRLLLCALVGVLCCTVKVESILLDHKHFLPAALDTVLSPYQHWRGRRGASSAETSHSVGAADTGDPCQAAVGHLGAACVNVLQKLPEYMEAANVTLFVQAVERLCDESACITGLNAAFEACHQDEVRIRKCRSTLSCTVPTTAFCVCTRGCLCLRSVIMHALSSICTFKFIIDRDTYDDVALASADVYCT